MSSEPNFGPETHHVENESAIVENGSLITGGLIHAFSGWSL